MNVRINTGPILDDLGAVCILIIAHAHSRRVRIYASQHIICIIGTEASRQCSQVLACRNRSNCEHAVYIFHDSMT
jgi:hypothetical protein